MKKALFWPYRYSNMKESWKTQTLWLSQALREEGYIVLRHKDFKCQGLENLIEYNWKRDKDLDVVIYNHADISHLTGNIATSKSNWFFKPTVPTKYHTTLDELGYGSFSSISYKKPSFEDCNKQEVSNFFNTKVKEWVNDRSNKWGNQYKLADEDIKDSNYYLVLGQCGGDEVVTRHDFGNYFTKLENIVKELVRIGNKNIIVKLHPFTDGTNAKDNNFSKSIALRLIKLSKKVTVYIGKSNIHEFIEKANCVILANSGAGFEALMYSKPIIAWGYPEYHWVSYNLRHLSDLIRAIKLDWFNKENCRKFLYWYTQKYCFYNLETCKRRVKELCSEK